MIGDLGTTLLGELRLQARQPLAVLLLLGFPVFLGIAVAAAAWSAAESGADDLIEQQTGMADPEEAHQDGWSIPVHVPAEWEERLADRGLTFVDADSADASLVQDAEDGWQVQHDVTFDGLRASSALRTAVTRELNEARDQALIEAGLGFDPDEVMTIEAADRSTQAQREGATLGTLIPMVLSFTLLIAALVTALDVFTGEKERHTIETLLTTGVDRRAVVTAKLAVVGVATGVAGAVFLATLAIAPLVIGSGPVAGLGLGHVASLMGIDAILAAQVASITAMLAIYADDYKSASMLSAPLMLIVMAPVAAPMFPVELGLVLAAIPLANVSLACRDLLSGTLSAAMGLAVLGFSLAHVGGAIWALQRMLNRETALIASSSVVLEDGRPSTAGHGLGLFVLAFIGMWFFAQPAQIIDLVGGMVFTQIVVLALPALGAIWWMGMPWSETLSLRAPSPRNAALAVAVGLVAPACGMLVFTLQNQFMPAPESLFEGLSALNQEGRSFLVPLVVFCMLPALCEELLFRGAILGLLRRGLTPAVAIGACAVMFGLFHISVHRWAPTGILGLVTAIAVWRSGSLWTGVTIHFLNNTVALGVGRWLGEEAPQTTNGTLALGLLGLGAVAAFAGVLAMGQTSTRAE